MGLTDNERAELHALASNIRDDRTRLLIFKMLGPLEHGDPYDAQRDALMRTETKPRRRE